VTKNPTGVAAMLNAVLQKRLGVALAVWGEAGIGKSYHATQLLRSLPFRSASFHATTPLATVVQTLPDPKKLPLWAERSLTRLSTGEAVEGGSVLAALGVTLAALAPFVLHLEDIHEADEERSAFIQELAKVVSRVKGIGLVVTSRREPLDPFTVLKLEPLSQQESDTLLETELRANLPKEATTFIYAKAAGNPLYTLEYLRYLTRQGFLWNDGKQWYWREPEGSVMPVTVEALIEHLLEQAKTQPLQRYVLETRAFLPLNIGSEVWAKVARVTDQDLQTAVTELAQQSIFKESEFAHPLFREVAYRTLTLERKQNLARRAMTVLEHEPARAALFVEDARLEPEKALALLQKAAEHVEARSEVEAAKLIAKAVDYATGKEKSSLALEAAEGLRSHDMPGAVRLAEHVLVLEPDNIPAKVLLSKLYGLQYRKEEAKAMFGRLPSHYRGTKEGLETLIEVYNRCEEFSMVVKAFKEQAPHFPPLNATVIGLVMGSLSGLSRYEEVEELAAQTLAQLEPTSWAYISILHALAFMHNASNEYEKAESEFRQAIELIERHHDGRRLHIPLLNRAQARMWLGHFAEAKVDAERSRALALVAGDVVQYAHATSFAGLIEHEFGHYERAEELLLEAQATLAYRSPSQHFVDNYSNLSTLYLEWSGPATNPVLALKYARTGLELARNYGGIFLVDGLTNMTFAESRHGNPHYALELAEEAKTIAAEAKMPRAKFHAAEAKGTALQALQRFDEAGREFVQAERIGRELGLGVYTEKVALKLDRLNQDGESAKTRMQWFQERGLMNGVSIAKGLFPELAEKKETPKGLEASVRLEVLGSVQARGDKVTPIRGRKRQELLAFFLEARMSGRSEVSRLTLFDVFYSNEDELKASASLKSLVYSLRETLGENAITTTNNGYALGDCTSDAELFLQTLDTALWRGIYLEGLASDESTVREPLYLALFEKAKTLLETDPKEAARVASILVEAEPYDTEYLRTYLTALRLSKHHGKLTRHYQESKKRLLEVGETLPEAWQDFLTL
jgi:tetratricopeptide (TPR) repeat protein